MGTYTLSWKREGRKDTSGKQKRPLGALGVTKSCTGPVIIIIAESEFVFSEVLII